jgi:hypothetical protein
MVARLRANLDADEPTVDLDDVLAAADAILEPD